MLTTIFSVKTFVAFVDAAFLLAPGGRMLVPDMHAGAQQACVHLDLVDLKRVVGRERSRHRADANPSLTSKLQI